MTSLLNGETVEFETSDGLSRADMGGCYRLATTEEFEAYKASLVS